MFPSRGSFTALKVGAFCVLAAIGVWDNSRLSDHWGGRAMIVALGLATGGAVAMAVVCAGDDR